jgi:hypothetical protein
MTTAVGPMWMEPWFLEYGRRGGRAAAAACAVGRSDANPITRGGDSKEEQLVNQNQKRVLQFEFVWF